jgi:MFS family permease
VTIISTVKMLMTDCFATVLPALVTGGVAAGYVAALSAANMAGRLGWAAVSDKLGRRNTYYLFAAGIPAAASIPLLTSSVVAAPSAVPLVAFVGGTALMVSFYGGLFSVLPAYLADVFGQKNVGAIHGRALTAWSAAALTGPTLMGWLRGDAYNNAINDLVTRVDPAAFQAKFGAPISELAELVAAKTVTIHSLLELTPAGTPDPTPSLYNTTMYSMCGIMAVAAACNAMMRPVANHHFTPNDAALAAAPAGGPASTPQAGAAQVDRRALHTSRTVASTPQGTVDSAAARAVIDVPFTVKSPGI